MRHRRAWQTVAFVAGLAVMVGAVVYVASRTSQWLGLVPTASYILFFVLFLTIVASMGSAWYVSGTNRYQHWAVMYGCYGAGALMSLIFSMVLVDVVTLPFSSCPEVVKGVAAYGLSAVMSVISFVKATKPEVKEISVPIRGLSRDINIVQLSDLHLGHFRGAEWLRRVVAQVNGAKPDFVAITGDIFESFYNLTEEVIGELKGIEAPIYYVAGNHDKYVNLLRIKDMLRKIGVRVLENEVVKFEDLQIAGTGLEKVEEVIDAMGIDPAMPCVMLRHYPNGVEEAVRHGVDLMLSGHTHGGQLFPVTLINRFAFRYESGLYQVGDGKVYVSDGAGTTGPPMRLGTKGEITVVRLVF